MCGKLLHLLGGCSASRPAAERTPAGGWHAKHAARGASAHTVNDFLFAAGLDDINMFRLTRCVGNAWVLCSEGKGRGNHWSDEPVAAGRYIRESKALFKVAGYGDAAGALPVKKDDGTGACGHSAAGQNGDWRH